MNYFIFIIIAFTIVLLVIYKDYLKTLKYSSIATVLSGVFTFMVAFGIKYIMMRRLNFIRVSDITKIIVRRFVLNAIWLLIIGLVEATIYFIIAYGSKNKKF